MKSFVKCLIILAVLSATIEAAEYRRTGSDGKQYYINNDQYNWYQAMHKCEQQNQQLVEIGSAQKNNVLLAILRSLFKSPPNLWLGANDEYNEAKDYNRPFYWSTSGKRMTFSYWSKNNPDNDKRREHCVHIWDKESTYTWNDIQCTSKMGFICEDNYVSLEKCDELEAKRKLVSDISTNVKANNQQRQNKQNENLVKGMKSFKDIDNQFGDVLVEQQKKLEAGIAELMKHHIDVTVTALTERNKSIQSREVEIQTAVDRTNKEFSDKLESSQKSIDGILKC